MRRLLDAVFGSTVGRWGLALCLVLALALSLGAPVVLRATALAPEPLPPALLAAEEALAGPGVFGLYHFNVGFAVGVEREFLGEEDREALLGPLSGEHALTALWRESGVDLRGDLDQAVMAISQREGEIGIAVVLLGRFPPDALRQALPRVFETGEADLGGRPAFLLNHVDEETCEATGPMALHMTPERLVLGDPATAALLLDRLDQAVPAAVDLSGWRAFRGQRLLSVMMMAPQEDPAAGVDNPFGRMAAEAARDTLEQVDLFFAGLAVDAPDGFDLDASFHSKGGDWPRRTVADFTAWRETLTGEIAEDIPSLMRLQQRLQLAAEGEVLSLHLDLDRDLLADVAELPADLLKLMFKGLGASPAGDATAAIPAEEILSPEEMPRYEAESGHDRLAAWVDELDSGFRPAATSGPFGVKVREIRLKDDPAGPLLEFEVAAQSGEIPNMAVDGMHGGSENPPARVVVTAVRNAAGDDLMRAEDCGRDRNPLPAQLSPQTRGRFVDNNYVAVPIVAGEKTVRLKPGTRLADVAAIEGEVLLRLPTRVERQRVTAPFAEQVVEDGRYRLKFAEADPASLTYELSGEGERVLAVHALNAAGDYLASGGAQSSGRLFGAGRSVTRDFRGQVQAAEVVLAREEVEQAYTFRLNPARPRFDRWDYPQPYRVEAEALAALEGRVPRIETPALCEQGDTQRPHPAFAVCIEDVAVDWGGGLSGQVVAAGPKTAALESNLSAMELRIERLQIAEAGGIVPMDFAASQYLRLDGGQNEAYLDSSSNRYFRHHGSEKLEGKALRGLEGSLLVRLPTELAAFSLDVAEPGNRAEAPGGLTVSLAAITEGGISLAITGPRDRLVQFIPYDATGNELATNAVRVEKDEEGGGWTARLQTSGEPARLEVVYAAERDLLELPLSVSW